MHKAYLGWITRTQKTAKTECGNRVSVSQIAIDSDADCPACRAVVEKSSETMVQLAEYFVERHGMHPEADAAKAAAADPNRFRTIYFL